MMVLGRRVIPTTLDPVPGGFRLCPGALALNRAELEAIQRNAPGDVEVIRPIVEAVRAADMAEALQVYRAVRVPRRRSRLAPSVRMLMLNTLSPGRRR